MQFLRPNWAAPSNVHAFSTLRQQGFSQSPFDSFNLAAHVGDKESAVASNRALLVEKLDLPQEPLYLNQTHGIHLLDLPYQGTDLNADGAYSKCKKQICLVMTADCLPVLFCNRQGTEVAATHAGWRGLCGGILEETVARFKSQPEDILVWFAPAISRDVFQVGEDVRQAFMTKNIQAQSAFFPDPTHPDKYLADLYQLARQRLNAVGVNQISGGEHCTFKEKDRFFSYRREGQTGRMASLIWFS